MDYPEKAVIITQYVNPHQFWFYEKEDDLSLALMELLHTKLDKYINGMQQNKALEDNLDTKIFAYYYKKYEKWTLVKKDEQLVEDDNDFIIWLMDYGVSKFCKAAELVSIPRKYTRPVFNRIHFAGLHGVLPLKKKYCVKEKKTIHTQISKWPESAIQMVNDIIVESNYELTYKTITKDRNCRYFGILKIDTQVINDLLIEENEAFATNNFDKDFSNMEPTKRWVMLKPLGYVIPMANNNKDTKLIKTANDIPITFHDQPNATVVPVSEFSQNKTPSFEKQIPSSSNRSHTTPKNDQQLNGQQSYGKGKDVKGLASVPCNKSPNTIRNDQLLNGQHSHGIPTSPYSNRYENSNTNDQRNGQQFNEQHSYINIPISPSSNRSDNSNRNGQQLNGQQSYINIPPSPSSNRSDNSNRNDQRNGQQLNGQQSYINTPTSSFSNKSDNYNRYDQRNGHQSNKNHALPITSPNFSSSRGITKMNNPTVVNQTKMVQPVTPDTLKPNSSTVKDSVLINKSTVVNHGETIKQVLPTNHKPKSSSVRDTLKRNKVSRVNESEAFDLLTRHQETELGVTIHTRTNTVLRDSLDLQDVFVVCEKATPAITKLANSNFSPEVLKVLHEMGWTKLYRIQTYAWPHLLQGFSIVIINGKGSGKTSSFVSPVCSLLMDVINCPADDQVKTGPKAIILCHSATTVRHLGMLCKRFLDGSQVITAYGAWNLDDQFSNLLGGCSILVTTPPCLLRLQKFACKVIHYKKLRHVIVDDYDIVVKKYGYDLNKILKSIKKEVVDTVKPQYIFTSSHWLPEFKTYLDDDKYMELCFGDFMQVALYFKAKFNLRIAEDKMDMIKDNVNKCEKTLIICRTAEEVDFVARTLVKNFQLYCISCHEKTDKLDLALKWAACEDPEGNILICNDEILPRLKIKHVQNLIHYSMPSTWTYMVSRYVPLKQTFSTENEIIKSFILLDENNNLELPRLISFLKDTKQAKIAPQIECLCNNLLLLKEKKKEKMLLCNNILEFGDCNNINYCGNRHVLNANEEPDSLDNTPKTGIVKFKVCRVHSPIHYSVRILGHTYSKKENFVEVQSSNKNLLELATYMIDNDGKIEKHYPLALNDICVTVIDRFYQRCKILEIIKKRDRTHLQVKLIDDGRIKKITSDDVLAIPEKFQIPPPTVMDVYITNIEPYDLDQSWDDTITRSIETIVKSPNHDEIRYLVGEIELAFANTLILNNVKMYKESFEKGLEINSHIITKNYGVGTDKPLKKLIELVENYRNADSLRKSNSLDEIDGGETSTRYIDPSNRTPKIAKVDQKKAEENSECTMSKEINKSVTWQNFPKKLSGEMRIGSNISDNVEYKAFENKDAMVSKDLPNIENIKIPNIENNKISNIENDKIPIIENIKIANIDNIKIPNIEDIKIPFIENITPDNLKLSDKEDIENIKITANNTKSYNSKVNYNEVNPSSEIDDDNKSLTSEYITSDDDNAFQLVEELLKKYQATRSVSNTPTTDITVIPKNRKPAEVVKKNPGTPMHSLTKVFKELETIWAETESTIILRFSASDVLDYIIDLNENTLFIQATFKTETRVAFIKFFGSVDSTPIVNKIRGLNIHLTLKKLVVGYQWKHLMASKKKEFWLKYNPDALKADNDEIPLRRYPTADRRTNESNSDCESSEDLSADEIDIDDLKFT